MDGSLPSIEVKLMYFVGSIKIDHNFPPDYYIYKPEGISGTLLNEFVDRKENNLLKF